jgi:putative mRNA 3-end processing factor
MLYYANGSSFLYTSDFNAVDSMLFEAAKPVECDELLMECTYGKMEYSFPERSEVHSQIQEWASQVLESGSVIFGAYELGKAQELVAILNEAGITPLVSKEVFEVANIYNQFGKKLECLSLDAQEARESLSKNFVAILPFSKVNKAFARSLSQATGKKVLSANATGWSLSFRQSVDKAFCLSDHSDFKSLLEFAEGCNPKKIWCTHGFAKEFSTELRKKGFDAEEIKKDNVFSQ